MSSLLEPELTPDLLMAAYRQGIFPMADEDGSVAWYSPHPRAVIKPGRFHASKTLRQLCRQGRFEVTVNRDFTGVMTACADRPEGTWISPEFVAAYTLLHQQGHAHSVEAWRQGELAGGLYGVAVGTVFCGESMFHRRRDASKVALVFLVERMIERGFTLLDVQFMTDHLASFGAEHVARGEYLKQLAGGLHRPCRFDD